MTLLEKSQILHPFMCQAFGFESLRDMLHAMVEINRGTEWRIEEDGVSSYANSIMRSAPNPDQLKRYDANIQTISYAINMDGANRNWKPFQYIALLFTEHYLHRYFTDQQAFLAELEAFRQQHDKANPEPYTADDLRTLAFQSATGSGKTLILHANIKQYMHHLRTSRDAHSFNKIILVTPDERMSRQHETELRASGFEARLFSQDRHDIFSDAVEIIDLHKLANTAGEKRVAVESFEENNLVLVDEGHLGTGGDKWRDMRKRLSRNGFTFEYSATFNQATAKPALKNMRHSYGKSLIFDYSYKHFYADGFGKDYNIRNLTAKEKTASDPYLLACLLQFYQQRKLFAENSKGWSDYKLANPLLVFLGNTVTASNTAKGNSQSDVMSITRFLAWVMASKTQVVKEIGNILNGDSGLIDADGNSIFAGAFEHIKSQTPAKIYDDLAKRIFNGAGKMQLVHCTQADEIQLCAGDASPFGVINVGATAELYKKFTEADDENITARKDAFQPALFDSVDNDASRITTVIGAQKFAAGWSSWRVSTMGLLNVGAGEGPQIIQMFGRGVRLKGKNMTLKRHTALNEPKNDQLTQLETLNIFGVRANYMDTFKTYLAKEDIATEWKHFTLPVTNNFGRVKDKGLKILKLPKDKVFEKSTARASYKPKAGITVQKDLYATVQAVASESITASSATEEKNKITIAQFLPELINDRLLYETLLERKFATKWHNLEIRYEDVKELLDSDDWFALHAPPNFWDNTTIHTRLNKANETLKDLTTELLQRVISRKKSKWESDNMELEPLTTKHPNFIDQYDIFIDPQEAKIINDIDTLITELKSKEGVKHNIGSLIKDFHGYQPLLHKTQDSDFIRIQPVPLNEGEADFVKRLVETELDVDEIFLIRNQSRGAGVGFYSDYGGYFPDFILWLLKGDQQHIILIDPKGLGRVNQQGREKFRLHTDIKDLERKINQPNVFLHSYIWSVTCIDEIASITDPTPTDLAKHGIYLCGDRDGIKNMLKDALK